MMSESVVHFPGLDVSHEAPHKEKCIFQKKQVAFPQLLEPATTVVLPNIAPFRYVPEATYLRSLRRMRSLLCNSILHFILV